MSAQFPLASARAARFEVLESSPSTNAELVARSGDFAATPHVSVLVTRNQTSGRGRLNRVWQAPPNAALAISVLLREVPTDPDVRGWIPLIAGLAMTRAVRAQLTESDVTLKWPNDVLVDGRKISGILAEAGDSAVVVGAGVNTAMTADQLPVPMATSFAVLGRNADDDRLVADYLSVLVSELETLRSEGSAVRSGLHGRVSAITDSIGREVVVSLPGGAEVRGRATGTDERGRLLVSTTGGIRAISAGDIVHARSR